MHAFVYRCFDQIMTHDFLFHPCCFSSFSQPFCVENIIAPIAHVINGNWEEVQQGVCLCMRVCLHGPFTSKWACTRKKRAFLYPTRSSWLWDHCEIWGVTDKISARLEWPLIADPHPRHLQVAKEVSILSSGIPFLILISLIVLREVAWGGNGFSDSWWLPIKPMNLL